MASAYFERIGRLGGQANLTYHCDMLPIVRKMAKAGMTELEIADSLDVAPITFKQWQSKYPRLLNALELGRKQSIKRVTRALYHRSVGYSYDAERVFNDKGNIVKTVQREHVAPDVNAIKFYLSNKDPENWQDRSNLDVSGNLNVIASTVSAARTRLLTAKANATTIEAQLDSDSTEALESE